MRHFYRSMLSLLLLCILAISISPLHIVYVEASNEKLLVVVLPYDVPRDPSEANATIDAIALINKLNYEGKIKLYMFIGNYTINGKQVYPGSLLVIADGDVISDIENNLKQLGINYFELTEKLYVPLYYLKPAKIAILDVGSTYTIHDVLKELGFDYTIVTADEIANGILETNGYDLLILPPGSGTKEARLLGKEGAIKVAEFLVNGGGYIGVCAGAYAPIKGYNDPTSQFQIVDATLKNWPYWWLGTGIVHVKVVHPDNPVVYGFKDGFDAIYWNGPVLTPYDLGNDTVLGIDVPPYTELVEYVSTSHEPGAFSYGWGDFNQTFVDNIMAGGSAVTLSYYGEGKIILFSFHPELLSGDPDYAPNSTLPTKYNWRLWFNAIYYVSKSTEISPLYPIHGTWMWPSTFKYIFLDIYNHFNVTLEKAIEIGAELLAQELASHGITDLFIEVKSTRGYAFFPGSKYVPVYPAWPYNATNMYIPLIEALHKYGIRVHAWIVVFRDQEVWGPKDPVYHVGKSKSNWKPYPVTKYVRPGNTTYIETLAGFVKELLDMGFDGIHLDYIRYGHMVYSFAPKDIERAKARGINVSKVIDAVRRTFYSDYPGGYDPTYIWRLYLKGDKDIQAWFEMRREDIEHAITVIAEAALSHGTKNGGKPILSAALMPDITINGTIGNFTIPGWEFQLLHYGQMWEDFAKHGYWLIPMAYFKSYGQPVEWVKKVSEYASRIAAKYGVLTATGIQAWYVDEDTIEKEEKYAIEGGSSGYVYFRWYHRRAIYRTAVGGEYKDTIDSLYKTLPRVISLAGSTGVNAEPLLTKLYLLDVVESGHLYPEPGEMISNVTKTINSALDSIADLLREKISDLKSLNEKTHIASEESLQAIEQILVRASSLTDVDTKTEYLAAVEDYVRSAGYVLAEQLYSQTEKIEKTINDLEEKAKDLENKISEQQKDLDDLKKEVDDLEKDITNIKKDLSTIEDTVNSLSNKINDLDTLKTKLNELESKVSTLEEKINTLSSNIEKVNNNVNNISGQITIALILAIISIIASITLYVLSKKK